MAAYCVWFSGKSIACSSKCIIPRTVAVSVGEEKRIEIWCAFRRMMFASVISNDPFGLCVTCMSRLSNQTDK